MSIYFNIIGIRKYVIKKIIYYICNTIPMGLLSAMTIITKTKINRNHVKILFFLNIISYFQDNFLAHSLCHVTYVTYFNVCSDPDVKLANV